MKLLVITANPKKKGALATLTGEVARGARDYGVEVEEARLADMDIGYCRFCLKCRQDLDSAIGPCAQKDDMGPLTEKIVAADGIVLACPTSGGHSNAIMRTFFERTCWTMGRATRNILWVKGCPEARPGVKRKVGATVTTAGIVPTWSRFFCYGATKEMSAHMGPLLSCDVVSNLWVGKINVKGLKERDRRRAYKLGRVLAEKMRVAC